ncbi:hypothetical protein H7F15_05740 [Pontibacter sp. Tf4]|uniref:hypothetical protein n=1 Tax=Pontibacter sp. Tf4 TaxID=2761620 RepID=UPI001624300B|nr:hypothetical protein [Pontibacter sp. Tf4]MBB6610530.1 hypothetical protein [Pontibacter sp. Tf4]
MRYYLLLFVSLTLLLFMMPKNDSLRSFAQQSTLKKGCTYSRHFGKKPCAKKCLKHQAHSGQQSNAAGIVIDCSQQVYAIVNELPSELFISFVSPYKFTIPHIRKHLAPVLEYDPEPPRIS